MLQVAAYCRVSTDKEDQANSFEAQQRYFHDYIERQPDWVLQGIYADEGISGTSTHKRVEFNKMLYAAEMGQIDLIVTKEVSRFTRNTVDALQITRDLQRRGVGVLFLTDSLDTRTSDGELRLTIMSSMAQDESRKTSIRSKWGQTRSMERGVVFGGSLLGYDVIGGKMTVNPEGAEIVRLIFHKYLQERKGCSTIARELREAGILSSKGNCLWSSATVTKILKNEKYCGDLIQKKTYTPDFLTHEKKYNHGQEPLIELKDHHEAIIDRETWQAVQRELSRRNTAKGSGGHGNRYPLSGKIRCGECGKSFVSRTKKRKDGSGYKRWCCFTATNEGLRRTDGAGNPMGCSVGRQIRDDVAMDILRRSVNAVTLDKKAIISNLTRIVESVLASGEDSGEQELRRLELELEKLQARNDTIHDRFFDETITKADYQRAKARCESEMNRVQEKITAIKQRQALNTDTQTLKPDIRAAITGIVTGRTADDAFYGHLLQQMTVYQDGRVEVALNLLPAKWTYVLDGLEKYRAKIGAHSASSVPISVNRPLSSG